MSDVHKGHLSRIAAHASRLPNTAVLEVTLVLDGTVAEMDALAAELVKHGKLRMLVGLSMLPEHSPHSYEAEDTDA